MRSFLAMSSIVGSAVAFTVAFLPLATPTFAATCDDVQIIFARGSGQALGAKEYQTFRTELESSIKTALPSLKYQFYELGTSSHGGASYSAAGLNALTTVTTAFSAGTAFEFGRSVNQGITELKSYVNEVSSSCKNTKFVMAGYSQGAMVLTNSVPNLPAEKFVYVATFGDPKLYLPEGEGPFPSACRGQNLSDYRVYAPNCYTSTGSLGAKKPYRPTSWSGKIGLWCRDKDVVCGAGLKLTGGSGENVAEKLVDAAISSHTSYDTDGQIASAAVKITEKLATAFPKKTSGIAKTTSGNRDTVILLDDTGSMRFYIDEYKEEAKRLAKGTIDAGGRVSLWTYGDLADPEYPRKLVDFGTSYQDFVSAIDSVTTEEDRGGDAPESVLNALYTIMQTQKWKTAATKSIVLLTDATFHSPDLDNTTISQVVNLSLSIDPVNVYIISPFGMDEIAYRPIVNGTNGQFFYFNSDLSKITDLLLTRPSVTFPLDFYTGKPGETFTFTAETSTDIEKYEWDLDFDGTFETKTSEPTVSAVFSQPVSGYLKLRATDKNGLSSTASALVTVTDSEESTASLELTKVSVTGTTASLDYLTSDNTVAVLVAIGEENIGFTTSSHLDITDLVGKTNITLTPLSSSGKLGEAVSISVEPDDSNNSSSFIPLAPNTGVGN